MTTQTEINKVEKLITDPAQKPLRQVEKYALLEYLKDLENKNKEVKK